MRERSQVPQTFVRAVLRAVSCPEEFRRALTRTRDMPSALPSTPHTMIDLETKRQAVTTYGSRMGRFVRTTFRHSWAWKTPTRPALWSEPKSVSVILVGERVPFRQHALMQNAGNQNFPNSRRKKITCLPCSLR
jgi:hypothetical protein